MTGRREFDDETWRILADTHRMLLRLAGHTPDELLSHARHLLGGGDLAQLPDLIARSAAQLGIPLARDEVALLREIPTVLDSLGGEPDELDRVPIGEEALSTGHGFAPASPDALKAGAGRIPACLDLTGGDSDDLTDLPSDLAYIADLSTELTDPSDDRAVDNLSRRCEVIGVWRTWRSGPVESAPSRPVYIVEVASGAAAWDLALDAQRALLEEGDPAPQVEVYWTGDPLPPYQTAARARAALLWAQEAGRVQVAGVYDGNNETAGHFFTSDHFRLSKEDRGGLLARLGGAAPIPPITGVAKYAVDVVEPGRGTVVPSTYRTDGQWVWSEALAYYLAEYELAPPSELMAHFRTTAPPAVVDGVGIFRAALALMHTPS